MDSSFLKTLQSKEIDSFENWSFETIKTLTESKSLSCPKLGSFFESIVVNDSKSRTIRRLNISEISSAKILNSDFHIIDFNDKLYDHLQQALIDDLVLDLKDPWVIQVDNPTPLKLYLSKNLGCSGVILTFMQQQDFNERLYILEVCKDLGLWASTNIKNDVDLENFGRADSNFGWIFLEEPSSSLSSKDVIDFLVSNGDQETNKIPKVIFLSRLIDKSEEELGCYEVIRCQSDE